MRSSVPRNLRLLPVLKSERNERSNLARVLLIIFSFHPKWYPKTDVRWTLLENDVKVKLS